MIKTVFEKAMRIGRAPFLLGVIYRRMYKGHPGPAPTATRGMPIRGDLRRSLLRRSTCMPDLRRLILLSVVSALAALLLVAAPASAATFPQSFANQDPITIPASGDIGAATPYPSSVVVSGMPGPITDVNVTLHGVGHTNPRNIGALLVSPSGDTVNVMRLNCSSIPIEDFTWILDQQASTPMPQDGGVSCPEFVYRPNPFNGGDPWPAPAPAGPHGVSLNDFNGENANGTWRLFVADFGANGTGDMEGGWTLTVTTGPADTVIPGTGTSAGPANPYPATRTISGHTGLIGDLNVSIDGIWHQRPDDLDLLLVGPQGEKVILMSDACGTFEVADFAWVWNDEAAAPMPDGDGTNSCNFPQHRPADYEPGESWPAPAPPGPHATALSAFDGTDPNGEWRLFVSDDSSARVGFFTNRFQLQINTKPTITPLKPAPGSKTRTTRPLISAKVSDAQTELSQVNIQLFVDNRPKAAFAYSQSSDTLTYRSTKLKAGRRHTVRIVANDGVLSTTRSWSFKVIRRR
jgi:subtilisin-like proprotein convertase family protein